MFRPRMWTGVAIVGLTLALGLWFNFVRREDPRYPAHRQPHLRGGNSGDPSRPGPEINGQGWHYLVRWAAVGSPGGWPFQSVELVNPFWRDVLDMSRNPPSLKAPSATVSSGSGTNGQR